MNYMQLTSLQVSQLQEERGNGMRQALNSLLAGRLHEERCDLYEVGC